jgi:beta-glucosidase
MKKVYFLLAFSTLGMNVYGQKTVDQKVAELLSKMTLEEKVGQMVQYSGFEYATGPQHSNSAAVLEEIKKGKVGSMLNVAGVRRDQSFQKLAMQSRLKIPLLFGQDVIHGYRTTFPVNLGQAASWDLGLIENQKELLLQKPQPMEFTGRLPRWWILPEIRDGEE